MTTDGTPGPLYPDFRSETQRRSDGRIAAAQSQALTESNTNPRRADDMIRRLQAVREQLQSGPGDPPILIDVIWPDQSGEQHPILVARDQLLLRDPAGPPSGAEHDDTRAGGDPGCDPTAYDQAVRKLSDLGYQPRKLHDEPQGPLPYRTFLSRGKGGAELVQNRNQVREETGADVDLNYVCVTGHTVKDEDTPELTAVDPAFPPAEFGTEQIFHPITVAVIDTGINREDRTDGWLATIAETPLNEDPLDVLPADGILDASAGHGTFVCGVLQQVAPQATIVVYRKADTDGMATVQDIGNAIIQAARDGANIISLSMACPGVADEAPAALLTAVQTVQNEHPEVLIVASAGNNGTDVPMYPAAIPGVIGVAALHADLTPADWSSFGDWVTCSAVGVGVASTFVPGVEDDANDTSQKFGPNAWAIWSGTSFSAPQIAGTVARLCQLSPNPVTPVDALQLQLLSGAPTEAGYGAKLLLLPGS
jgi:subtilisin family serine protease